MKLVKRDKSWVVNGKEFTVVQPVMLEVDTKFTDSTGKLVLIPRWSVGVFIRNESGYALVGFLDYNVRALVSYRRIWPMTVN